jgi:hypothetical protein
MSFPLVKTQHAFDCAASDSLNSQWAFCPRRRVRQPETNSAALANPGRARRLHAAADHRMRWRAATWQHRALGDFAVRASRMFRISAKEIDQRAELDRNVTSARIIEDEIPPLQRPIRQHWNQSAVGNIRGDQRLGHLHDAEAIESRPQGEIEVVHMQRPIGADFYLLVRALESPRATTFVVGPAILDAIVLPQIIGNRQRFAARQIIRRGDGAEAEFAADRHGDHVAARWRCPDECRHRLAR